MGTADFTETRLAALQDDLAAATSAAECIPVLGAMTELAAELAASGDADRAGSLLSQLLADLQSAAAAVPDGGEDYLMALLLQAEVSLLRDGDTGPVPDLDTGIDCLRQLREWLPADEPTRVEFDARLAAALMTRMGRAGGQRADVDEAGALLMSLLDLMKADNPGRRRIISALAVQRATRYAGYDGTAADREAAVNYAAQVIQPEADRDPDEADSGPDEPAVGGHLVIAWMVLARQLTSAQRSAMLRRAEFAAAQLDGAASALMAELGTLEISLADAETAISHLRQIPAGPASDAFGGMVPMLWGTALFVTLPAGGTARDVSRVADELRRAAAAQVAGTPEPGELLAMRAAVLAAAAAAEPAAADPASTGGAAEPGAAGLGTPVTDALSEAVAMLPAGHPVRTAELSVLQQALGRQVTGAVASDDPVARLEDIVAALDRMPSDDPETARAVATVGLQVLGAGASHRSVLQQQRLVAQLERVIGRLAPDDPVRPFAQCMYWALISLHANMEHQRDLADRALAELMSCADSVPAGNPWRPYLLASVGFALIDRHGMGGEMRHLDQAGTYVARAFEAIDPAGPYAEGTPGHGTLLFLRGHLGILRYYYDHAPERLTDALDDLERAVELVGPENPVSSFMISSIQTARIMRRIGAPSEGMFLGEDEKAAFGTLLTAAELVGRDHPEYPLLLALGAGGFMLRGLAARDLALINRAIPGLASACSVAGLANRERTRLLEGHGLALLTRHALTGNQRDLSNAIDRLEEARRAVEQEPGSPDAASVLQRLASAYRARGDQARGDVDRAAVLGLAGLHELVGDVLLQDTDENALYRGRQGTNEATEMACWLLRRGRSAEAVSALELGRGMVLYAASSGAGVETALRESGHADLADEWVTGAADESDLRYRTMLALEQSPAQARLLSPPSVGDIAAAVTQAGADALVYLLPQDDDSDGLAVLIDRDAAVRTLSLPGLKAGASSPVGEFLAARRSAEACMAIGDRSGKAAAQAAARPFWLAALGALGDWAWRVAVGHLLSALPVRAGSTEPRIVLVPGGELGLVPWHAARRPGDGRYACQEAIISYAASARQFVDAVRRRPRPWAERPVLISDSSASLYYTAVGIASLHADHYGHGSVFGRARTWLDAAVPGAASATPDDVLAALPHAGHPGASLLHVGCHGQVQVPVLNSSLLLGVGQGGKEIRIDVQEILQQARQRRSGPGEVAGGLVILASCFSDVTETDYDEALTLTTAFLSAGATGVVGAGWMVGEAETAVFMTLFHHFLNGSHPSPARALRETQLWMLDSARKVPGGLPEAIAEEAAMARESGLNPYANPEAWAAFSYRGR